ncbi:MAG: hypothetical protein ACRDOA_15905 [Streptosporangiaceae bacterium]
MFDVMTDATAAWRRARTGAVLVFDDYANDVLTGSFAMPGKVAADAFLALIEGRYKLIFKDWTVAIRKAHVTALAATARVRLGPDATVVAPLLR